MQTRATVSNLAAGTYTVTVTDANGCTTNAQGTVIAPPQLKVTVQAGTIPVLGGTTTVTLTVTGGTGSDTVCLGNNCVPAVNGVATFTVQSGTYTFSITDANGCGISASNITIAPGPMPQGPISPYYLTAGEQGKNWVVQVDSVVNSWKQQHPQGVGEYPIVVGSTVRTHQRLRRGDHDRPSTLAGVFTGQLHAPAACGVLGWGIRRDHNYRSSSTKASNSNSDWSNPALPLTLDRLRRYHF